MSWLALAFFYTLHVTYRYRFFCYENRQLAESHHPKQSFLLALWHENLFASLGAHSFQRISPIISLSKDGDVVSFVATKMGMQPVRGSSSRGGQAAKSSLQSQIESGLRGAITLDGPRGPRRRSKLGIFHISAATGAMILPSTAIADRSWKLKSWDEFKIPKPFARVAIVYGKPYQIEQVTDRNGQKQLSDQLGRSINELEVAATELLKDQSSPWTDRRTILSSLSVGP